MKNENNERNIIDFIKLFSYKLMYSNYHIYTKR